MITILIVAELRDSDGNPLPNKEVEFYRSTNMKNYVYIGKDVSNESGLAYITDTIYASGTYYYKAVFWGDEDYDPAEGYAMYVYYAPEYTMIIQILMLLIILIMILLIINQILGATR